MATLRDLYPYLGTEDTAAALGLDLGQVRAAAKRYGACARRNWSPEELAELKRLYGRMPAAEVARRLGRKVRSVWNAAKHYGLARRCPRLVTDARFLDGVRRLHAEGLTDTEIAGRLGTERHTVCKARNRLGLPAVGWTERRRELVRRRTATQLAAAGVPTLGALRVKVFRDRARAAGWPDDLRPRAVQILNALWDGGPMTRRELADVVGLPWRGSRKSLCSNDPEGSYLAHLMNRGLVICLGRLNKVTGRGRGHSTCVYTLSFAVQRRKPA